MKKPNFKRTLLTLLILSVFITMGINDTAYAVNDDPGAGRLSGTDIPEEFYENASPSGLSPRLQRYGSSQTQSPYTGKTYTHQDQFTDRTIVNGIDVSEYQKTIDWQKVKAAGIDFAFIRVGGRGWGKPGTLYRDSTYDTNMQNAALAGVNTGIYIFSQAITEAEAIEEAQYILNNIGTYTVTMPLILDFEFASGSSDGGRLKNAKLSKAAATKVCLAFCETIAAAGYTPMVYANPDMLNNHLNPADISASYPIWLANYTTNTSYNGTFSFWQYSSEGKVNGISGNVDMNFYYSRIEDNFLPHTDSISSAAIAAIPDQPYTGKNITPALTVTHNGAALTAGTDYIVSYSSNKNIGTATAKITGKNHYKDTKTVTFKIVPKKMAAVKAKKRATSYITLSWSKDTNATGYQIYRSASSDGSYKKIKSISKNATTSFKNTGLTSGQRYYYKIRSYKKTGGKTYYSEFSAVKAIDTKIDYTRLALGKKGACIYDTTSTGGNIILNPTVNVPMKVNYGTKDASGTTWYNVTYETSDNEYTGFIPAGKVTIAKQGKINGSKVNVRKSNTTNSKKLTQLSKNKKVTVLSTKTKKGVKWYKVTFKKGGKTYTGWISAPYVKII